MSEPEDIENSCTDHPNAEGQPAEHQIFHDKAKDLKYKALRAKAEELAAMIVELCPEGQEMAGAMLALGSVGSCVYKSFARNDWHIESMKENTRYQLELGRGGASTVATGVFQRIEISGGQLCARFIGYRQDGSTKGVSTTVPVCEITNVSAC